MSLSANFTPGMNATAAAVKHIAIAAAPGILPALGDFQAGDLAEKENHFVSEQV